MDEERRGDRESDTEGAVEATEHAEVGCVRRGGQGMGGGSGKRNEVGVPLACSLGVREKLKELEIVASAADAGDGLEVEEKLEEVDGLVIAAEVGDGLEVEEEPDLPLSRGRCCRLCGGGRVLLQLKKSQVLRLARRWGAGSARTCPWRGAS
jgi:hypothetical protein